MQCFCTVLWFIHSLLFLILNPDNPSCNHVTSNAFQNTLSSSVFTNSFKEPHPGPAPLRMLTELPAPPALCLWFCALMCEILEVNVVNVKRVRALEGAHWPGGRRGSGVGGWGGPRMALVRDRKRLYVLHNRFNSVAQTAFYSSLSEIRGRRGVAWSEDWLFPSGGFFSFKSSLCLIDRHDRWKDE